MRRQPRLVGFTSFPVLGDFKDNLSRRRGGSDANVVVDLSGPKPLPTASKDDFKNKDAGMTTLDLKAQRSWMWFAMAY